jgi:hypothetical protein
MLIDERVRQGIRFLDTQFGPTWRYKINLDEIASKGVLGQLVLDKPISKDCLLMASKYYSYKANEAELIINEWRNARVED